MSYLNNLAALAMGVRARNAVSGGPPASITNVTVDSPLQQTFTEQDGDYFWKMDEVAGVDLVSSINSAHKLIKPVISDYSAQQTSLRKDGTGFSTHYNSPNARAHAAASTGSNRLFIPYGNGFTIEGIFKPTGIFTDLFGDTSTSGVGTAFNVPNDNIWSMRFDNWGNHASTTQFPVFYLLNRTAFDRLSNIATGVDAQIRSTTPMVLNQVYHLLATIRPSTNDVEFWVDGISQGTAILPADWHDKGVALNDLYDASKHTVLRFLELLRGAARPSNVQVDNLKIHLLEANQSFVDGQFQALNGAIPTGFRALATATVPSGSNSTTIDSKLGNFSAGATVSVEASNITFSGTYSAIAQSVTIATAQMEFISIGTLVNTINSVITTTKFWLSGSTTGTDYEIKLTHQSGSATLNIGDALVDGVTWHNLGTNRILKQLEGVAGSTKTSSITAIIRKVGDATSEKTATLFFQAESISNL